MGMFNTEVKPVNVRGLENLVAQASQSPLTSLSKGMKDLDNILTKRDKEQYTSYAIDKLKNAKSVSDVQGLGLDLGRLSDAGKMQYSNSLDMINRISNEQRALSQEQRAKDTFDMQKTKFGQEQDALLQKQITNEVLANVDSMTPEQIEQAKQYSGLDALTFDKAMQDKEKFELDKLSTMATISKSNREDLPSTIKEMELLGYPLTQEGYREYVNAKDKAGSKLSIDDIAIQQWNTLPDEEKAKYGNIYKWKSTQQDQPTTIESEVEDILKETDFEEKYSELSIEDQKTKAREIQRQRQLESTPAGLKMSQTKARATFNRNNQNKDLNEVVESIEGLSDEEFTRIKAGEESSEYYKKFIKEIQGTSVGVKDMANKSSVIYSMTKEEWNKGFGENLMNDIVNSLPDNWIKLDKESKVKALNAIKGNSILGDIFFTYLNEVNKGAPSDADLKLMEKIVTAGRSASLSATKKALSTFMNNVIEKNSSEYSNSMKRVPLSAKNEYLEAESNKQYKWDDGFYINKEYTDTNGNKAIYLGGGKWKEVKQKVEE